MHRSHIPIQKWFEAAYQIAGQNHEWSATQLKSELSLGCHETAWHMLQRFRKAMVSGERSKLKGRIEVGKFEINIYAQNRKKILVLGAVEVFSAVNDYGASVKRTKHLRLLVVQSINMNSIRDFLIDNIEADSIIFAGDWINVFKDALKEFTHNPPLEIDGGCGIERAFQELEQWLHRIYRRVCLKHLQSYFDEFIFRFYPRKTPRHAFDLLLKITPQKRPRPR